MRSPFVLVAAVLLLVALVFAGREKAPNAQELARLEARAAQAAPQEQCILYAELVYASTDLAVAQMRDGDEEHALTTVQSTQGYAAKIDVHRRGTTKRLKNAEILLEQAAFRLRGLLMGASLDNRPFLERALKQVNEVQSALMLRVFER